jgi:putative transposase
MVKKKGIAKPVRKKRELIEVGHKQISIRRQCDLLGLNRASYYYEAATASDLNLRLMNLIDEQYTRTAFYGWRKMTIYLRRVKKYQVNGKRVRRLMRQMGLQAIYPQPRVPPGPADEHKIYPYLLRNLKIVQPNQVWSTDITYIRMAPGFMYLTAIIDWYSRYVLAWQLSNSLDNHFCLVALEQALAQTKPQIFNTDQGTQFTAHSFTDRLAKADIQISMDGRGRALDNIFIERLWRSVKYENIYLSEYTSVSDLQAGLTAYFNFYNHERFHQSLDYLTPAEVHFGQLSHAYVN